MHLPATPRLLRVPIGLVAAGGGFILLWGSQDAMLVLIHWIGEARALGPQNVVPGPEGGLLLTNPGAMFGWMVPIWLAGACQVVAGLALAFGPGGARPQATP